MTTPPNIKSSNLLIRPLKPGEAKIFLPEMLYQAVFCPPGEKIFCREAVFVSNLSMYIDGFGREHDHCLIAEVSGKPVGAIWVRLLTGKNRGYGYVDDRTPELAIALLPEYRGKGIGTQLMEAVFALLRERKYPGVSLSVHKGNDAVRLYRRLGCQVIRETKEEYIMYFDLGT